MCDDIVIKVIWVDLIFVCWDCSVVVVYVLLFDGGGFDIIVVVDDSGVFVVL